MISETSSLSLSKGAVSACKTYLSLVLWWLRLWYEVVFSSQDCGLGAVGRL
jgi:hypothetical protein